MTARLLLNVATAAIMLAQNAVAQEKPLELTPAGKAILQDKLAADSRPGVTRRLTFPLAMCAFPGGLCGAVNRDGGVAIPPRYDWVGTFADGRAAVRLGGLYGFVDESGRVVVEPRYPIVGDYKFGFVQVDIDGKSGLLDRDGKMVIEPKYGSIEAISSDRFRVSEVRQVGGQIGAEDFSGLLTSFTPTGGISVSRRFFEGTQGTTAGIIDLTSQWIEAPRVLPREFDKNDPSITRAQQDKLWGLARPDGSWLVQPKFEQLEALSDGLARVTLKGKFGFIDKTGNFVIEPVFDKAWWFIPGVGRTSVQQGSVSGVIDRSGAWVFKTEYQQVHFATTRGTDGKSETAVVGWHFKLAEKWGVLDLDGKVLLDADFDQTIQHCKDGRLVAYKNNEWLYFRGDGSPLQPLDGRIVDGSCGAAPPFTLKIGDKLGLVDADSRPITPVHFDAVSWAGPDAKNVKLDGKWGRIGIDGRWLLEPKFDYLSGLVAAVDGKRGFMRADGTWVIEPKFEALRIRDAETGFATVAGATGVLRLADQSWALPPRPGVLCDIASAIMHQSDGKRSILSRSGETWIEIGAERIGVDLQLGLLTFLKDGKWGLVDTVGHVIVEPRYEEPIFFTAGLRGVAWARSGSRWCAIDRRGNPVASIPCTDKNPTGGPRSVFACKVEP